VADKDLKLWHFGAAALIVCAASIFAYNRLTGANQRVATPPEQLLKDAHSTAPPRLPRTATTGTKALPPESPGVRLLATSASTDSTRSRATLEDVASGRRLVTRLGDKVAVAEGFTVDEIEARTVTLVSPKRSLTLHLDQEREGRPLEPKERSNDWKRLLAELDGGQVNVDDLVGAVVAAEFGERDDAALVTQIRFAPEPALDGEAGGLRVVWLGEGSFYEQLGIEVGDVLLEVNGIGLDSAEASDETLEAFSSAAALDIVIRSGDRTITLQADTVPPIQE